jgi:hypothetical protein
LDRSEVSRGLQPERRQIQLTVPRTGQVVRADLIGDSRDNLFSLQSEQGCDLVDLADARVNKTQNELIQEWERFSFLSQNVDPEHGHRQGSVNDTHELQARPVVAKPAP